MVKTLVALVRALFRAPLFEFVGASLVVYGVFVWAGVAGASVAAGVALLLKSLELDLEPAK